MSAENEALMRRWFEEVWNKGRVEAIDELFATDGIAHGLGDSKLVGPEGFKTFHQQFMGAFPGIRITIDDMISQGDQVAVRFSILGTHRGDHLGIPATHREVSFPAMSFVRWRDGQIIDGWNSVDMLTLLQQIDAVQMKAALS